MKRAEQQKRVNEWCSNCGFPRASRYWLENGTLLLTLQGALYEFPFRGNMSKTKFHYELGRLSMLADLFIPAAPTPAQHAAQIPMGAA